MSQSINKLSHSSFNPLLIGTVFFGMCLTEASCVQKLVPELTTQQATNPLSYYLPPAYDITINEAQDLLVQKKYRHPGSYMFRRQLDWKLAEDFGNYIEIPFKQVYKSPLISDILNPDELAKFDHTRTEWHSTIGKANNEYFVGISCLIPFRQFAGKSEQPLLDQLKRKGSAYSGLFLSFNVDGQFISGLEVIEGHGHPINMSSQKLPSTELEEIRAEMLNPSSGNK